MNPKKLMKQFQQMQEKMEKELGATTIEAAVGGGMVTVVMDGHKNLVGCRIDPEVIDPEDPEMLQDLIVSAFNEASRKVDDEVREKLTGGMPSIPGMPGFGF